MVLSLNFCDSGKLTGRERFLTLTCKSDFVGEAPRFSSTYETRSTRRFSTHQLTSCLPQTSCLLSKRVRESEPHERITDRIPAAATAEDTCNNYLESIRDSCTSLSLSISLYIWATALRAITHLLDIIVLLKSGHLYSRTLHS